jgi:hypothetical protein
MFGPSSWKQVFQNGTRKPSLCAPFGGQCSPKMVPETNCKPFKRVARGFRLVVGRAGRLAVSFTQTGYMECQQPSGQAISPSTYAHGWVDLTPERAVMRSGPLEGGVLTLNRRTGRGPGGSNPKVTRLRCSVYVEDCPMCGIGEG